MTFPTQDEILERVEAVRAWDIFGFETTDYIEFLEFRYAARFLKEGVMENQWTPAPSTRETVLDKIKEYMPFAWEKANHRRGLSASRSMCHMKAWLWLLGEVEVGEQIMHYDYYGKPQLRAICEHFEIDWQALDDGRWANEESHHGDAPKEAAVLPWRTDG